MAGVVKTINIGGESIQIFKTSYGSFSAKIKNIDGHVITLEGDTAKSIEADVIDILKERHKPRAKTYRELSRRNWKGKEYFDKELKRILGNVQIATVGGAVAKHVKSLEEVSHELIREALSARKYNDWTGNLSNSYVATVVTNGKVTHKYHIKQSRNKIKYGKKRGTRYVELMFGDNHNVAALNRKFGRYYGVGAIRYLKKWEVDREDAYRNLSMMHAMKKGSYRIGYIQGGTGDGRVQSGVTVEYCSIRISCS